MESSHEIIAASNNNGGGDDVTETNVEPITNRIACKTGHILNELTASVWFSYALLYFQNVAALSPLSSGVLFSLSQLLIAVGLVVVSFSYDKRLWKPFLLYGRRQARHILGSAGVLLSWPLTFVPCLICKPYVSNLGVTAYYSLPVVLFSVCWSLAEASYSSLMREIQARTNKVSESSRSSIVRVCNVCLYILLWVLLQHSPEENLNRNSSKEFARLAIILLPVGFAFVFAFHLTVLEPTPRASSAQGKQNEEKYSGRSLTSISVANQTSRRYMSWCDWLTEPLVYQVGLVCVFTNIAMRLLQVYLPLYLIATLRLTKVAVLCTTVIIFGTCMWFFLQTISRSPLVYVPTLIFGCMSSLLTMVTPKLQQKLTGNDMEAAHFVSSAFQFLEYLFLGGMVLVIQMFCPDGKDRSIGDFIRVAFPAACGSSIVIPLVVSTAFMNSEQGPQTALTVSSAMDENREMQASIPISHCVNLPGSSATSTPPVDIELSQRRRNNDCGELQDIENVKRALDELHRLPCTDL